MTLTKREKFLLKIAVGAGLLYLIIFMVFLPALEKLQKTQDELSRMQLAKSEMQMAINMLGTADQSYEDLKNKVLSGQSAYFEAADNTEIDWLITNLCLKYNLRPLNLQIDSVRKPVLPSGTVAGAQSGRKTESGQSALSSVNAAVSIEGDFQSIKALTDEILSTDYMRLKRISFNTSGNRASASIVIFVRESIDIENPIEAAS